MSDSLIRLDDRELLAAIDRAIALLTQPRQMMDDIGVHLERSARLRFDFKTDPNGQPWAPLSPTTIEIYASDWFRSRQENRDAYNKDGKAFLPGSLLVRTNQLRASLTHNTGEDWTEVGTSRVPEGGRWQIGWLHETGTRRMPRRGILLGNPTTGELGADDQADVLAIVNDTISGALFG